ncbi:FeoB-associated Cys-rich membrane protein [Peptoniphilus sp. AGMB00490]|uniref:FeoB-associated Cys-rich membrane protein n=1 Tax=Peptoniphilus faecalis TaxID=2731255 RepID=A0A848RH95_9FIRM|nr:MULTISPECIES: FeoB-associated Cys-rich membrane protein [Peptoniphilus]NMW85375.1 FeoB-associated Cys-rich membrane protein [Peptoniphilus faecalis]
MNPINVVVALVIILAIVFAAKRVISKKGGCDCGCNSCHSACSLGEKKK